MRTFSNRLLGLGIALIVGCSRGASYESDFAIVATALDGGPAKDTDVIEARLDAGAPGHVGFLREQLRSSDSGRRALAAAECRYAGDDSLAKDLYRIAQSDSDAFARVEALRSLGKMKAALGGAVAWQIVTGPYERTITEQAISTLYEVNPKLAVRTFKQRLEDPTFKSESWTNTRWLMVAYVLESDPHKESAEVLKEIQWVRNKTGKKDALQDLEEDAKGHRPPRHLADATRDATS